MKDAIKYLCLLRVSCCVLFIFVLAAALFAAYPEAQTKPPEVNLPAGVSFDVVVLQYDDSSQGEKNAVRGCDMMLQKLRGGRAICLPPKYIVIAVREDRLKEVKDKLGDTMIQLSPRLQ